VTAYPSSLHLLIGGKPRSGGGRATLPVLNPANEEVLGQLPLATKEDLDDALAAAEAAYPKWRALGTNPRAKILRKAAALLRERSEAIARVAVMEQGKSIHQMRIEVEMSANIFEWYAEEGRRAYGRVIPPIGPGTRLTVRREPVGPIAAFAPWNFPLGNPARKLGAPLAAGCSVILKPAEETPAAALAVAQALMDAGLPEGVMSIVFGVPSEVSTHLISSPVIRGVHFTGSVPVGKELAALAATTGMKRTVMELGGHGPVLVFDDADLESVLDQSVTSKYRNSGQVCVSPTRFYVQDTVYEDFVKGFTRRAKALKVGDGLDESVQMGPLAHPRRIAAMETLLADAAEHQATLNAGGHRLPGKGWFFEPTVLSNIPNSARIMNEEPFGPVALINPVTDFETAVREANRLPYGLAAYAFTNDARRVTRLGEEIEAGMIGLNTFRISVPESPFGGVKESGHGSEEGIEGLDACLVTKFVSEA
jgi:succinate-semialdehyde dehydrogenase/glutarate-semialdehyde dehydrogenase